MTMMHCRCTTETENDFLKAYVKEVIIVSFISLELLMESLKSFRLFCETSTHPGRKELKLEQYLSKKLLSNVCEIISRWKHKHFICSAGNSFEFLQRLRWCLKSNPIQTVKLKPLFGNVNESVCTVSLR